MKKNLWVMVLVLSSLFAGTVAAESSRSQQDQVFFNQLVQQAKAPMSAVLVPAPSVKSLCSVTRCNSSSTCWAVCPGGVGSSYCDVRQHECYPF
ncbi:MAG: hypothetical protein M3O15_15395 [Acidobacteriota bacterium]|nr:hypothetical protein [Acidobacteriota bacterium]